MNEQTHRSFEDEPSSQYTGRSEWSATSTAKRKGVRSVTKRLNKAYSTGKKQPVRYKKPGKDAGGSYAQLVAAGVGDDLSFLQAVWNFLQAGLPSIGL